MKEGDRVREKYSGWTGTIIEVLDVEHEYNTIVKKDNSTDGLLSNGTIVVKDKYLEVIDG